MKEQKYELKPFAITFTDGYYSVKQCRDIEHARERAGVDQPNRTVKSIQPVT